MGSLAAGATWLGLDPNTLWGPGRRALFWSGIGALLVAGATWLDPLIRHISTDISEWVRRGALALVRKPAMRRVSLRATRLLSLVDTAVGHPWRQRVLPRLGLVHRRMEDLPIVGRLLTSSTARATLSSGAACLVVVIIYLWIVSVGRWSDWPPTTSYYELLAEGFLQGQLSLPVQPDPALAHLANPYDPEARRAIPVIPDASYFDGKYYLYWGPVPAVVVAVMKRLFPFYIPDSVIAFAGVTLTALFGALILNSLWRTFFRSSAWWILPLACLGFGLVNPLPWLLGRPAIYEAASAAGQGFLIGGVYFLLPALTGRKAGLPRLALASVFLGLAGGSRLPLLLPSLVLLSFGLWRLASARQSSPDRVEPAWPARAAILSVPFALILVYLAWYNLARFGSPFEFGQRFALASADLNSTTSPAFSPRYIPVNAFNYLLTPLRRLPVFPFVKPLWGRASIPFIGLNPGSRCFNLQVTGMLVSSPFLWFSLSPAIVVLVRFLGARAKSDGPARKDRLWTMGALTSASLTASVPMLSYCNSSMNYLADLVPLGILCSAMYAWTWLGRTRSRVGRTAICVLILSSLATTVLLGTLLAVTGYDARFEKLNPLLFDRITRWFAR